MRCLSLGKTSYNIPPHWYQSNKHPFNCTNATYVSDSVRDSDLIRFPPSSKQATTRQILRGPAQFSAYHSTFFFRYKVGGEDCQPSRSDAKLAKIFFTCGHDVYLLINGAQYATKASGNGFGYVQAELNRGDVIVIRVWDYGSRPQPFVVVAILFADGSPSIVTGSSLWRAAN